MEMEQDELLIKFVLVTCKHIFFGIPTTLQDLAIEAVKIIPPLSLVIVIQKKNKPQKCEH